MKPISSQNRLPKKQYNKHSSTSSSKAAPSNCCISFHKLFTFFLLFRVPPLSHRYFYIYFNYERCFLVRNARAHPDFIIINSQKKNQIIYQRLIHDLHVVTSYGIPIETFQTHIIPPPFFIYIFLMSVTDEKRQINSQIFVAYNCGCI